MFRLRPSELLVLGPDTFLLLLIAFKFCVLVLFGCIRFGLLLEAGFACSETNELLRCVPSCLTAILQSF
jgi:hypothetical protein